MNAVIVANGIPTDPVADKKQIPQGSLIIAADGGADYCRKLNLVPDVIIGDMDSITGDPEAAAFRGAEIIRHPARKDATDLELAIDLALARGAQRIIVIGALGGRWDMSVGNLQLMARPDLKTFPVTFVDGNQEVSLLNGPVTAPFIGKPGDTLSLIPIGQDATGVTLEGLEYPLENGQLDWGSSIGISNVLLGERASVSIDNGVLICVFHRKNQ